MILIVFISDVRKKLEPISFEFFLWLGALLLIYLLNARLPFLVGILLLAVRIYYSLRKNWQRKLLIVLTTIIVGSSFSYFLLKTDHNNTGDINSMDARWSIWSASIDQIEENLWLGVGDQNTIEAISTSVDDKFRTKYRNYNAHNQFIEVFLSFGLITFVLFVTTLGLYYKNSTFYGRVFIISASILFLVESYLQRQAGMVLFSFWLFFFYNYDDKSIQKHIQT
jgi:O-antigen ligase